MDIQGGFRVGPWAVSPLTGEIESEGRSVHLEPKVMEVLVVLAEKAQTVVLRDELLDRVWGRRAAISDEPLTRCIAQLRQAFGDSSRDPKLIQTVPKRGYRLMVPAEPVDAPPEQEMGHAIQSTQHLHEATRALRPWQGVALIGVLAAVGLIAFVAMRMIPEPELDRCLYDPVEQSLEGSEAYEFCQQGIYLLDDRSGASIRSAIERFRAALRRDPDYGSAIVNLARAFVLLPTYEEDFPEENCWIDDPSEYADCYEAAITLLWQARSSAPYIERFSYGIQGYVFTKQRDWKGATGAFDLAVDNTKNDADMWQWYSQLLAAVGYMHDALDAIDRAEALDPDSPVILDRLGVIWMWLGDDDEAREWFRRADEIPHAPYAESELVRLIRQQRWDEAKARLLDLSDAQRNDDTEWADVFIEALQHPDDRNLHAQAVRAVELAIDRRYLTGQREYGAWAYLDGPERAVPAALRLLRANPDALDVEFLFAPETRIVRNHDEFGRILSVLRLDEFWSSQGGRCPALFDEPGERDWCE